MFAFSPTLDSVGRVLGRRLSDITSDSVERWEISPAERGYVPSAVFLPNQTDRIRSTQFGTVAEVVRHLRGNFETMHNPTVGYRLRSVDLVDGVLYSARGTRHLRPRSRHWPAYRIPQEDLKGALYESWVGNRWFGNWLLDDCLAYRLAEQYSTPITTTLHTAGHAPQYEARLGISPNRLTRAHFEELFVFSDLANNSGRRARATDMRNRLIGSTPVERHAGVLLLRGSSGDKRLLTNEQQLAERLCRNRGFRVLDPAKATLEELVRDCAGAAVVAGVEGGHLVHGLMLMPPDATLFVIQPPDRTVSVLKMATDRQGQSYGFVVGEGDLGGFHVNIDEVEQTLDMVQRAPQ